MKPVIDTDYCTGCGLCEHACVTKKASITIVTSELVLGKVGSHYIKGWDKNDEQRLQNAHTQINTTEISSESAVDSLNDMGGLLDD